MPQLQLDQDLFDELADLARGHDCELVWVEWKGNVLRLILDRPGGITLDYCEKVSREASAVLDVADIGRERYVLEVSSPGLDRQLYWPGDWERFVGRSLKVTFRDDEGRKKTVAARLDAFDPTDGGRAEITDLERGETLQLPLDRVQVARLQAEI